ELLFLMFKEINLRNHSSLHKLFYSLRYDNNGVKIMKNKILTERQVRNRSIIAGILALLIGLVWDYFQYKTLSFGTVFWNIVESVAFVIFMNIFMNSYYKKKSKKQ
ncbi:hypothetical protein SD915_06590, partial [Lactobacillus crispatus]